MRFRHCRKYFGLRNLTFGRARSLRRHGDCGAGSEDYAFEKRVASQAVGAVNTGAGNLSGSE